MENLRSSKTFPRYEERIPYIDPLLGKSSLLIGRLPACFPLVDILSQTVRKLLYSSSADYRIAVQYVAYVFSN